MSELALCVDNLRSLDPIGALLQPRTPCATRWHKRSDVKTLKQANPVFRSTEPKARLKILLRITEPTSGRAGTWF